MARRRKVSVYEPRKHYNRWRVEFRDGRVGTRKVESFATEAEAWEAYRALCQVAQEEGSPTVGEVIELYHKDMIERGLKKNSYNNTRSHLRHFFRRLERQTHRLTENLVRACYDQRRKVLAVDSHRNELAEVKTFCRWMVKKNFIKESPAENITPEGRRHRGKRQLTRAEARKFANAAISAGDDAAFACAIALVMGMRASEITRRRVRDVDPVDHVLTIEEAKTDAGNRDIEIPDILWPHFEQRIASRPTTDPLFPAPGSDDGFHWRDWVRKRAAALCRDLQITVVTAHGLRGTHATLARQAGISGHAVAAALGHESVSTTDSHYTDRKVADRSRRRRAYRVLDGGESSDPNITDTDKET